MRLHDIVFFIAIFFICGILLASITNDWSNKILIAVLFFVLLAAIFLIFQKYRLAAFAIFVVIGAFYYFVYDFYQKDANIVFDQKIEFQALVERAVSAINKQELTVALRSPYGGKIKITIPRHPDFSYGDLIQIQGIIKKPLTNQADYFAKDGILGQSGYPKVAFIKADSGSAIKSALFKIRSSVENTFKKILPVEKAAFLSGLTLGTTSEFSKEFNERLKQSGTSHLVALSGYNISIIVLAITCLFGNLFPKRRQLAFMFSVLIIIGFVIMTGAEASIVRAAIMGVIILLADQTSRLYSFRNAITCAALLMTLINPRVLVFDVGFQLSFAALLGIVYLKPAIKKIFRISRAAGFLSWQENFSTTVSAQLAVLPILILKFGAFSVAAVFSNLLILGFVPITMFLGFMAAAAGFASYYFALIVGWLVNIFLSYEMGVINIFSKFGYLKGLGGFGIAAAIFYYLILTSVVIYSWTKQADKVELKI